MLRTLPQRAGGTAEVVSLVVQAKTIGKRELPNGPPFSGSDIYRHRHPRLEQQVNQPGENRQQADCDAQTLGAR